MVLNLIAMLRRKFRALALLPLPLILSCGPATRSFPEPVAHVVSPRIGILVMAHGGSAEWNLAVERTMDRVRSEEPAVPAFGMADPVTLQAALDSLATLGVERVAVVRLFLSGQSFLTEADRLLGLEGTDADAGGPPLPSTLRNDLQVATHASGLLSSAQAISILRERVSAASRSPQRESVLLVAHGMQDEADDRAVRRSMDEVGASLRAQGFARVESASLREDWPQMRSDAERRIRAFVSEETRAGRRVLVVPVRLFGFGPYATVLEGLEYDATGSLLPHPSIADWILETAARISCQQGWVASRDGCLTA